MRIACSRIGSGSLDFTKSGKTILRIVVLKLFFAFSWVNVVHLACVLRLELSILIVNFEVADRMFIHSCGPHLCLTRAGRACVSKSSAVSELEVFTADHELRAQIARL